MRLFLLQFCLKSHETCCGINMTLLDLHWKQVQPQSNYRQAAWHDGFCTCWPFVLHTKFLPSFFKHNLNCVFQEIDQIGSSSMKARWMGYIFFSSLSDRLRNCRGAAVTPSQSVTATAFPTITQQEGSTAVLCQTHCQHNSSIHCLFFSLFWAPGHSFLFRFSICMRLCRGMSHRQKQTASMWGCDTDGTWMYIGYKKHRLYFGCVCMKTH